MFFAEFPEFVNFDNRKNRPHSPVTIESLSQRCETFLPPHLIKGKTVLDLGCCIGAMGHWCLFNKAASYTGVEVQQGYTDIAEKLLKSHWREDQFEIVTASVEDFFNSSNKQYDVVVMLGTLYTMLDVFGVLEKIASRCKELIVLDSMYPVFNYQGLKVIEIVDRQIINSADDQRGYSGVGVRPTPEAVKFILEKNGFLSSENILRPDTMTTSDHDQFNDLIISSNKPLGPSRFAFHFFKKTEQTSYRVDQALLNKDHSTLVESTRPSIIKAGSWVFDEKVARTFYQEALNNIPDYIRVINLCVEHALNNFKKDAAILDVGSALGLTVDKFINSGFINSYGVEKSIDMARHSAHIEHIYVSEVLPRSKKWDMITANWTLHFINQRKEYLEEIFSALNPGGSLILSEKMDGNDELQKKYVEFKLERGMSLEEIKNKAEAIKGVLNTKALNWYLDTLKLIGFKDIKIINTRLMFNTICCKK